MENDEMTTRELDRLVDWLIEQGFGIEKIRECLKRVAGTDNDK